VTVGFEVNPFHYLTLKTSIHQVKHTARNILFALLYRNKVTIIKYEMKIKEIKKATQVLGK